MVQFSFMENEDHLAISNITKDSIKMLLTHKSKYVCISLFLFSLYIVGEQKFYITKTCQPIKCYIVTLVQIRCHVGTKIL